MGKCLYCLNAKCQNKCPLNTNISYINELYDSENFDLAYKVLTLNNPLPYLTGSLCRIDERCVSSCVLKEAFDYPSREQELALKYHHDLEKIDNLLQGIKIAIIGSGASGLYSAITLARHSASVTIYEKEEDIFYSLRYLIPNERFNKEYLNDIKNLLHKLNITVKYNYTFGQNLLINDLTTFDKVIVATGTMINNKYLDNTLPACEVISDLQKGKGNYKSIKSAIVIGGGNVAVDVCNVLKVHNIHPTILYRRKISDMPATPNDIQELITKNIKIIELARPDKVIDNTLSYTLMNPNGIMKNNRMTYQPTNIVKTLTADLIVEAVGQKVDDSYFKEFKDKDNYYVVGDALIGTSSFAKAMANSKKVVNQILDSYRNYYFGGSFDPLTKAHEVIIKNIVEKMNDKQTFYIEINPNDYDFDGKSLSDYHLRKMMIESLINKIKTKNIVLIENNKTKSTYETLKILNHPYFIGGTDLLFSIDRWKNFPDLLIENNFYLFKRGINEIKLPNKLKKFAQNFEFSDIILDDISSSKFKETFDFNLVSDEVKKIIIENKMYK